MVEIRRHRPDTCTQNPVYLLVNIVVVARIEFAQVCRIHYIYIAVFSRAQCQVSGHSLCINLSWHDQGAAGSQIDVRVGFGTDV